MIVVQGSMPEHCSLCWMFDTRKNDCSICVIHPLTHTVKDRIGVQSAVNCRMTTVT